MYLIVAYDDGPQYAWSSTFTFTKFQEQLDTYNKNEHDQFEYNLQDLGVRLPPSDTFDWRSWQGRRRGM